MDDKAIDKIVQKKINSQNQKDSKASFGEKAADTVARFGGSWTFVVLFSVFCASWIVINIHIVQFDPYPFILLNLFLSCLAAIQAPIIIMSQNRMSNIDRRRDENAYRVNLKAELEIQQLQDEIEELRKELKNVISN